MYGSGDIRSKTCCFTGHRDIPPGEEQKILTRLGHHLFPVFSGGVLYFGVGGAQGFDMLAAEYILDLRDRHKQRIRIVSVLPFPEYRAEWPEEDFKRQEEIIRRSDKVVYVCPSEEKGAYLARDRKLVDESAYCISYCHRLTGGTAYTVRYALGKGIPVLNCSSWDVQQLAPKKKRAGGPAVPRIAGWEDLLN